MQSPDSDVDEDDDEGEEDLQQSDLSPVLGRRPPREHLELNMQISPFDVRFSQGRASPEFRDGRLIEETVQLIQAVRCEDGTQEPATWRLEAPFPAIEILQWRCKLRDDQTGRPRLDPKTGGELYDRETKWFTLDNRRLYCLQRVAAKLWPDKAVVDVVELPSGPLTRARQLKKFRTLDRGRSILVGTRHAGDAPPVHWCWRRAVGAETEESEPDVDKCFVHQRRRPRGDSRQRRGSDAAMVARDTGCQGLEDMADAHESSASNPWWLSIVGFLGVYVLLRVIGRMAVLATRHFEHTVNTTV